MKIREFRFPDDYPPTLKLWQGIETGVKVGRSDSLEEIEKKIQRDPDLFLLAEADGEIIGTVIGGYDGRRGMVYHLAVRQDFRKQGVGDLLLSEVEKRLQDKGCVKCYLLIVADNHNAARFYEHRGWSEMIGNRIFGKEFP
ncbi:MAG: GNAT family N-acetyltransferase [Chloroflexi bacterium]|nr:GNAT family N-acetyltransferase [Chloroflexota bacterium]